MSGGYASVQGQWNNYLANGNSDGYGTYDQWGVSNSGAEGYASVDPVSAGLAKASEVVTTNISEGYQQVAGCSSEAELRQWMAQNLADTGATPPAPSADKIRTRRAEIAAKVGTGSSQTMIGVKDGEYGYRVSEQRQVCSSLGPWGDDWRGDLCRVCQTYVNEMHKVTPLETWGKGEVDGLIWGECIDLFTQKAAEHDETCKAALFEDNGDLRKEVLVFNPNSQSFQLNNRYIPDGCDQVITKEQVDKWISKYTPSAEKCKVMAIFGNIAAGIPLGYLRMGAALAVYAMDTTNMMSGGQMGGNNATNRQLVKEYNLEMLNLAASLVPGGGVVADILMQGVTDAINTGDPRALIPFWMMWGGANYRDAIQQIQEGKKPISPQMDRVRTHLEEERAKADAAEKQKVLEEAALASAKAAAEKAMAAIDATVTDKFVAWAIKQQGSTAQGELAGVWKEVEAGTLQASDLTGLPAEFLLALVLQGYVSPWMVLASLSMKGVRWNSSDRLEWWLIFAVVVVCVLVFFGAAEDDIEAAESMVRPSILCTAGGCIGNTAARSLRGLGVGR